MARRRVRDRRADNRAGVTIYGLDGTKRLMRLVAPELKQEMDKAIRETMEPVVRSARANVTTNAPLSRWGQSVHARGSRPSYSPYGRRWDYSRLEWDPGEARREIKVRQSGRRGRGRVVKSAVRVVSDNPAAAVWETMGRGASNTNMARTARRLNGMTGKILYKAWDQSNAGQEAMREVEQVVREYERRLDARFQSEVAS